MVEHSAVNRVVAGSSPARGARAKEESGAAVPKLKRIRLRGQAVKTSPFHGGNTGSIPVGVIWRHSQVVRQRSATPLSPVRIWLAPFFNSLWAVFLLWYRGNFVPITQNAPRECAFARIRKAFKVNQIFLMPYTGRVPEAPLH